MRMCLLAAAGREAVTDASPMKVELRLGKFTRLIAIFTYPTTPFFVFSCTKFMPLYHV